MSRRATPEEIRAAYHERARRHHPDRVGAGAHPGDVMSSVNEAYRVLCDPGRRAVYDRSLAGPTVTTADPDPASDDWTDEWDAPAPPRHTPLSPAGPARFPWKLMLVVAAFGSAVVLVAAAFTDPPSEEPPDGILRNGSCVEIEANGDVREIACTGSDDIVVDLVIPTDARCPADTMGYRDRLGLGTVCIRA